ncbi:MAG: hypothetical protein M3O67_07140, partial [Bacteroidota bacterium]|nr:hypothetical protein [Bacteroidota bacterium]
GGASHPEKKNRVPATDPKTKTLHYIQNNIHDFAWFADKRFIVNHDTLQSASGSIIDVYTYYTGEQKKYWQSSVQFCKDAVRFYSGHVGEYPYKTVSVVQGPESFGGGMEYPTITVISPVKSTKDLDIVIAHEVGHNWFYGILATNERKHAWMDEGINSFYEDKYNTSKYGEKKQIERVAFETMAVEKMDQPIETPSENFSAVNYELSAYYKTAEWMRWLESQMGAEALKNATHEYFRRWQFKHPQPADFKKVMEESSGKNLDTVFALLNNTGVLPNQQRNGSIVAALTSKKYFSSYTNNTSKKIFTISPVAGYNVYDKFMAGILFTNYKLPPAPFQFLLLPLYATGSKQFTGLGKLSYSFFPARFIRKVNIFLNYSTFSNNEYIDDNGKKTILSFQKIVPGFRLTTKEKNPRSTMHKYIQWKTFLIGEDAFRFSVDTIVNGIDTSIVNVVDKEKENRTLNQLKIVVENSRALYPYSGELNMEQGKDFVRAAFTGKYFFNYPKQGGLDVRLFAGKFIYTGSKTFTKQFNTERYHLNMTGPDGYEDYTYSDYFIGRNKFEELPSQQIMVQDGSFKLRTDLLANKVGKTDDWLIATNFSSTIPAGINPLSVLPFKVPLKIFVDIGTYAEAWKKDAEGDHFLFDAGLQLSLLKETINIYLPIIYSSVYKDYIQSTLDKKGRLLKTISFSIDISHFNFRKIIKESPF